jgi:hypothetical protein
MGGSGVGEDGTVDVAATSVEAGVAEALTGTEVGADVIDVGTHAVAAINSASVTSVPIAFKSIANSVSITEW